MNNEFNETMKFQPKKDDDLKARKILEVVFLALKEKGYNPRDQIIGYILSGDPTYITSYNDARSLIRKLERDELLEEVLDFYIDSFNN